MKVGEHQGSYENFTFDITHLLRENNELVVRVTSNLDDPTMPYGKNVKPGAETVESDISALYG